MVDKHPKRDQEELLFLQIMYAIDSAIWMLLKNRFSTSVTDGASSILHSIA